MRRQGCASSFFRFQRQTTHFHLSYFYHYRFQTSLLTPQHYVELCENKFSRFAPNPSHAAYLLLQRDLAARNVAVASTFSFEPFLQFNSAEKINTNITVPVITRVSNLRGFENAAGSVVLHGNVDNCNFVGRSLCEIDFTPKWDGLSQQYSFYSIEPDLRQYAPIQIPRFCNSFEAQQLQKQQGDNSKKGELLVNNKDVLKRVALDERDPDQNTVMQSRAVDEYRQCAEKYGQYLYPPLTMMLQYYANIMHLSTLQAKQRRNELISGEVKEIAIKDRLLRPEWLHLLSFTLHPMNKNPQHAKNLGAARGCDNTRMTLVEWLLKWIAINVPSSRNKLFGQFDMLLDTQIIDHIFMLATINLAAKMIITQKIDALLLNPELIHASDLAALVATLMLLNENEKPISTEVIKIQSSVPAHYQPRVGY